MKIKQSTKIIITGFILSVIISWFMDAQAIQDWLFETEYSIYVLLGAVTLSSLVIIWKRPDAFQKEGFRAVVSRLGLAMTSVIFSLCLTLLLIPSIYAMEYYALTVILGTILLLRAKNRKKIVNCL